MKYRQLLKLCGKKYNNVDKVLRGTINQKNWREQISKLF